MEAEYRALFESLECIAHSTALHAPVATWMNVLSEDNHWLRVAIVAEQDRIRHTLEHFHAVQRMFAAQPVQPAGRGAGGVAGHSSAQDLYHYHHLQHYHPSFYHFGGHPR
jgi:hypothetical protein